MIYRKLFFTVLLPLGILFSSCKKDDPVPEINQEVITDLTLRFTELDASDTPIPNLVFEVKAEDPEGLSLGGSPQVGTIDALVPGKKYQMEIFLYNSLSGENVTEEVAEDGAAHQFYFLGSALVGNAFLSYTYGDSDENGNPIGLKGILTVGDANSGTLRLVLRHNLNKDFTGAEHPNFQDFEQAGGASDLDITFQVNL